MPVTVTSRDHAPTPFGRYALASAGIAAIFVVNGAIRELTYAGAIGDLAAHQVSAVTVAPFIAAYVYVLERRWPIRTAVDAVIVGATWVAVAVGFEFGFGHYVAGASWDELLRDYDLATGHVWSLVLLGIGFAPLLVRAFLRRVGA